MINVEVIGSCRTNNFSDLDASRKYAEAFTPVIPCIGKENIYAIYMNYECDYKGSFDYLTGVNAKASLGSQLSIVTIPEGKYKEYLLEKENALHKAIARAWANVWSDEESGLIERKYEIDYEIYRTDGSISIFVGIK